MKIFGIESRHLASALAAAVALAACDGETPDPASRTARDVPIADAESTDYTHLPGADGVGLDVDASGLGVAADTAVADAPEAPGPGRDAALRYMARSGRGGPEEPAAVRVGASPPDSPRTSPRPPDAPVQPRLAAATPDSQLHVTQRQQENAGRPRSVVAAPAPVAGGDPDLARDLNRQGIALIGAGRHEEAIVVLERAVALQPRDAEMLGNLGYAYMLAGEHRSARANLVTALELSPTRSATWLNLGQAYAELGQRDVAVDAVLKGYRYSSRKPSVRSALQRAATGSRHSQAWRETAGRALAQIGGQRDT